jgi:SET domain-containing protein 6
MLYEYLQGETSKWKPYIDVLPQTFDTPIFWTAAELEELQGTCLTTEKVGKQQSDEMLRTRIVPIVLQSPGVFYPEGTESLGEEDLLRLAHRMGSTIMAYAFDLEGEGEQEEDEEEGWVEDREGKTLMGMVPMADILNANAEFNVRHFLYFYVFVLRIDVIGACKPRQQSRSHIPSLQSSSRLGSAQLLWPSPVI